MNSKKLGFTHECAALSGWGELYRWQPPAARPERQALIVALGLERCRRTIRGLRDCSRRSCGISRGADTRPCPRRPFRRRRSVLSDERRWRPSAASNRALFELKDALAGAFQIRQRIVLQIGFMQRVQTQKLPEPPHRASLRQPEISFNDAHSRNVLSPPVMRDIAARPGRQSIGGPRSSPSGFFFFFLSVFACA